jgi:hypothetical protein
MMQMFFDDVVVTGVVNPKSRLESSVSVSSIGTKIIEQALQISGKF